MKIRSLSGYFILSVLLAGSMAFTGCGQETATETNVKIEEEVKPAGDSAAVVTELTDEQITGDLKSDPYISFDITGHESETVDITENGKHYIAKDTVSVEVGGGDPTGLIAQNISKDVIYLFDADEGAWIVDKEICTAWSVNNEALPGSCFKSDTIKQADLKTWFADDIPADENGKLYLKFKKKMGFFAIAINDENNSPKEQPFFTNGSGVFTWIGDSGIIEKNFKCMEGTITDEGELTLKLSTDKGEGDFKFSANMTNISDREYDAAVLGEDAGDTLYIEEVQTFEVSTSSLDGEMWKKECGSRHGNVSPELSWNAVDGASKYVVFMIDKDASNWLHMFVETDDTKLEEGAFNGKDAGYVGPYPPEKHEYDIYVIALKGEPEKIAFNMDATGTDISDKLNKLNIAEGGETGNVISYGIIRAFYEPSPDEENILR